MRFVVAVRVPERVPPAGLVPMPMATCTPPVRSGTPAAVCSCTVSVLIAEPAVTLADGWAVKASFVRVETVTAPLAPLAAVHDRYTAVTRYWKVPSGTEASEQDVPVTRDEALEPQAAVVVPPLVRVT